MKTLKPCANTPGQRHLVKPINAQLAHTTSNTPLRSLTKGKKRISGRNNKGRITTRHRGGGHKRKYRIIDFKREKKDIPAKVADIEYDPNRTANIALLHYEDGEKRYILAPQGIKVGQKIISSSERKNVEVTTGNTLPIKEMPVGIQIHCIELKPGEGARMCRSAGTYATYIAIDAGHVTLKLRSGEIRKVRAECIATIGAVGNGDHNLRKLGKAGRKRWGGKRPTVRGKAMNPVDHPMGGGEGKSVRGHPKTFTGKIAKGLKTRKKNKSTERLIVKRKKK